MSKKMFLLFSHTLTDEQMNNAKEIFEISEFRFFRKFGNKDNFLSDIKPWLL